MTNTIETLLSKLTWVLASFLMLLFSQFVLSDGLGGGSNFVVKPYTHSSLSSSAHFSNDDYLVLLSVPKRVNNQLRVDKELRVSVSGLKETYRINDGHTTEQAFNHYLSQLQELSAEVIYQCASRDCGRSGSWSDSVYHNSKLYGKDATQFYLASAVERNGEQWLVTVYIVERGNLRVYAHVETLKINEALE